MGIMGIEVDEDIRATRVHLRHSCICGHIGPGPQGWYRRLIHRCHFFRQVRVGSSREVRYRFRNSLCLEAHFTDVSSAVFSSSMEDIHARTLTGSHRPSSRHSVLRDIHLRHPVLGRRASSSQGVLVFRRWRRLDLPEVGSDKDCGGPMRW